MLKRVQIANLRGIREGRVDGLSRLTVLVGPNGSGKSTVLEACFLGATPSPATALGIITRRRAQTWNGARWVIAAGDVATSAKVEVEWDDGTRVRRRVHWDPTLVVAEVANQLSAAGWPGPYSAFRVYREYPPALAAETTDKGAREAVSLAGMATNNAFVVREFEHNSSLPFLKLVEPSTGEQLHDVFSRAVQSGRREEVIQIAKDVLLGLKGIEILTEEGQPRLFVVFDSGAVPATLAGDGIQALLRTIFELASPASGTVLLEEPEVHQHPRSLRRCAEAVIAAARRGIQVIATTHSLEFVDYLLEKLNDEEIKSPGFMTLVRTQLVAGSLRAINIAAAEAESARTTLFEDLR